MLPARRFAPVRRQPRPSAASSIHARYGAGVASPAATRGILSKRRCVAGLLAGLSPAAAARSNSRARAGPTARTAWRCLRRSAATSRSHPVATASVLPATSAFRGTLGPTRSIVHRPAARAASRDKTAPGLPDTGPPEMSQLEGSETRIKRALLIGPKDFPINIVGGQRLPQEKPNPLGHVRVRPWL